MKLMFDSVLKCIHFTLFDGVTKFEKFPKWEISERSLPGTGREIRTAGARSQPKLLSFACFEMTTNITQINASPTFCSGYFQMPVARVLETGSIAKVKEIACLPRQNFKIYIFKSNSDSNSACISLLDSTSFENDCRYKIFS